MSRGERWEVVLLGDECGASKGVVLAAAAHPDDIEFMMAGTMVLLAQAGFELHYLNIGNGSCGTAVHSREEIIAIRTEEAREAARSIGAVFHPPYVDDIDIYYERTLLTKLGALVREVKPTILLLQSPQDYMEDHQNSTRLMVSAAFCRGMRNFPTDPPRDPVADPVALYHASPYGLCDQICQPVRPDLYVDVSDVIGRKRDMLACHRSQKEWLDHSQGLDSYLITMTEMCAEVGRLSGRFEYAEGWRRHLHFGFSDEGFDPLTQALGAAVTP